LYCSYVHLMIFGTDYLHTSQGCNQLFISGGGNFHEISFDEVIVLIQPWYNFSQTVTDKFFFAHFQK